MSGGPMGWMICFPLERELNVWGYLLNYQVLSLIGHLKAKLVPTLTWDIKQTQQHRFLCSSNSFYYPNLSANRSCLLTKCLLWCRDSRGTFRAADILNRIHSSLSPLLLAQHCLPTGPSNLQDFSCISFLSSLAHGWTPTAAQLIWEESSFQPCPQDKPFSKEKN